MPVVTMPDNTPVWFPDEMPGDQIRSIILQKFPNVHPDGQNPVEAGAAENRRLLGQSANNFVSNVAQPFLHPIQTAENIGQVGKGVLQKVGVISGNDATPAADAVWQSLVDRYGSPEAISKTIHTDPVGFMADLSTVLGGGAGIAKMAGATGDVVNAVGRAASATDPLSVAGRAVAPIAKAAAKPVAEALGVTTGAGGEAIKTAYSAGKAGGDSAQAFKEGLSGTNLAQAVDEARAALAQLRQERGTEYRTAIDKIYNTDKAMGDMRVLDFSKVDSAVQKVSDIKNFKGQDTSPTTAAIRGEMLDAIDQWKALPPNEFHTAEGMDALKQKLGDILNNAPFNTPQRNVAGEIYNAVRQTIVNQAPEYAKVMKGYEEASGLIREIESTLSLKPNANIDTSLRKLQSVLRNNVNTNYGRRTELLDFLSRAGAPNLMERLAGQTLSSASPRGLSRLIAGGEGLGAIGALAAGHPAAAAGIGAGVLASSPFLVGGGAYGLGVGARVGSQVGRPLGQSAFQLGRFGNQ